MGWERHYPGDRGLETPAGARARQDDAGGPGKVFGSHGTQRPGKGSGSPSPRASAWSPREPGGKPPQPGRSPGPLARPVLARLRAAPSPPWGG